MTHLYGSVNLGVIARVNETELYFSLFHSRYDVTHTLKLGRHPKPPSHACVVKKIAGLADF